MVLRPRGRLPAVGLVAGAGLSAVVFSLGSHEAFQPLAVVASLLPLQLAALNWVLRHPEGS